MEQISMLIIFALGFIFLISPFLLLIVWDQKKKLQTFFDKNNSKIQSLEKDKELLEEEIEELNERIVEFEAITKGQNDAVENLANQFINDSLKFICFGVTANNYESSIKKAEKVFNILRKFNIEYPKRTKSHFILK